MDQSLLWDEAGRMVAILGLILAVLLLPILIVSLIIGIIQAATSVNEQTISLLPKFIVLFLCLILFGAGIAELLTKFTEEIFGAIASIGR
ncbi:flagellar biosynthetic protein FliQ [Tardiphaga sp.]|uniref:flagellar biosynthetic protein FliQ n=1 Tax=Tardiphaga sp. TaxID=1926292 RepID=UPI00352A3C8F